MAHPRYAPGRASKRLSLSIGVSVAAIAALLLLACGPLSATTATNSDANTANLDALGDAATTSLSTGSTQSDPPVWGDIPIKPSTFSSYTHASATVAPVAAPFGPAGATGELGIPLLVLQAYHLAAQKMAVEEPACHLPWWLLAGIGHTESGHAEDGRLYADGTTRGRILGPVLNGGIAGDAVITDTDHGVLDGDTTYDRAVGPMQFIPSTWASVGADGNGDGKKDPNNIFDATLAAGRYLCAHDRNLATAGGLQAAILSYNNSQAYLATVLAWGEAYRDRAIGIDGSILPVVSDVTKVRPPLKSRPPAKPTVKALNSSTAKAPVKAGSDPAGTASAPAPSTTRAPSTPAATCTPASSTAPAETSSSSADRGGNVAVPNSASDSASSSAAPSKSAVPNAALPNSSAHPQDTSGGSTSTAASSAASSATPTCHS